MSNSLPTQERKPHIQADIFGNCSGMASLIPSKPPSLPFSPDLLAYSHPQVPNTGYLESLKSTLPLPELAHVLMLLPASWNAVCGSFALLCLFFFSSSPLHSPLIPFFLLFCSFSIAVSDLARLCHHSMSH